MKEQIGVLGMKPMGAGVILTSKTVEPVECLHYAMSLPTSTVITGIDSMEVLRQDLDAVARFKPLSPDETAALLRRTAAAAAKGGMSRSRPPALRRHGKESAVVGIDRPQEAPAMERHSD